MDEPETAGPATQGGSCLTYPAGFADRARAAIGIVGFFSDGDIDYWISLSNMNVKVQSPDTSSCQYASIIQGGQVVALRLNVAARGMVDLGFSANYFTLRCDVPDGPLMPDTSGTFLTDMQALGWETPVSGESVVTSLVYVVPGVSSPLTGCSITYSRPALTAADGSTIPSFTYSMSVDVLWPK